MTDKCVVDFADGFFIKGQKRLIETFLHQGYNGDFLFFNDVAELGCPKFHDAPYAFKSYAMKKAQEKGYRFILWVDSSVYAVKPVQEAFDLIERDGYLLLNGGWCTGQWCSDAALVTLGVTREQLFSPQGRFPNWPHLMACVMGLDLEDATARTFLDKYYLLANDGVTIQGSHTNDNQQVSADPRVRGHRHDQTIASVISWKMGMRNWTENLLVYDETGDSEIKESAIFVLRHPG